MRSLSIIFFAFTLFMFSHCASEEGPESTNDPIASEFLEAHNSYRSEVGIDDLTWSEELAASATEWAEELAGNCDFEHSQGNYGENLWKGTEGAFSITDVVDSWGGEKAFYNYDDNSCKEGEVCGHYTQIVWEKTTEVGCGIATCDGWDIWVCQYLPQGNFNNEKPY